jgi:hypothetical protein
MDSIHLEQLLTTIVLYFFPFLVIIGLSGNLATFAVFSRKRFTNTVFSTYFRALAITDSLTLSLTVTTKFFAYQFGYNVRLVSVHLCRLFIYIAYAVPTTSGWILVVISLDRWLSIVLPSKFLIRKRKSFQLLTIFSIIIFNFVLYCQLFFSNIQNINTFDNTTNITINRSVCIPTGGDLINWIDLFNSTLVPFFLMIVFTILILKSIFESRKRLKINHLKSAPNSSAKKTNKNQNRDAKFAITSITLNVMFLITNVPIAFYSIYDFYVTVEPNLDILLYICTLLLCYINFGSIFFINYYANSMFKEELMSLIFSQENARSHTESTANIG